MGCFKKNLNVGLLRVITILMTIIAVVMILPSRVDASAASVKLSAPKMAAEKTWESGYTHPYNKQTNTIVLHWGKVKNAKKYEVYIYGGKYKKWAKYKTVTTNSCTVSGLERVTSYRFRVRAVNGSVKSEFGDAQVIKTARMDYDLDGWKAICRIVYHEVGMINDPMWDKPMVYVADCVVNRYVAAKYNNSKTWAPFYKKYNNIQDVIYKSGGFMSSAGLTRDGAAYKNVPTRVKQACWGAVYGKAYYKGIKNDGSIYYWCNRSYKTNSSKIAYSFKIPWGYFNIWRSYWG